MLIVSIEKYVAEVHIFDNKFGWLVGWLVGWLIGWSVGRSVRQSVRQSVRNNKVLICNIARLRLS